MKIAPESQAHGLPLFGTVYPQAPGYASGSATSRAAAHAISPEASALEMRILRCLATAELNADEVAGRLREGELRIRPRCTDLKRKLLVEPTGDTRPSALGNPMDVLRLTALGRRFVEMLEHAEHGARDRGAEALPTTP